MTDTRQTVSALTAHHPQCYAMGLDMNENHECYRWVTYFNWPINGVCYDKCLFKGYYQRHPEEFAQDRKWHVCNGSKYDLA